MSPSGRSQAPLSEKTLAEIASKNMDKDSPILARIFKEEAELEIWKKDRNGEYALLKTYPICRWSGDLGPKKKEGDRQAPEGFYTITPGQMNPASNYYLAFNTGFPNAYDRAWGYTGSELMVHGDCSSRGCYAMTDQQIQEIYALARESFYGGQKAFQLEAFPFRMTALNMARHRNNPNFAFWKMLKEGYDNFEATHQEPKVAVCEKRYVFDAAPPDNASRPLSFNARGKCPVYQLDKTIADVVLDRRHKEQVQLAQYIAEGVATVPSRKGIDGGMNPAFAEKITVQQGYDAKGHAIQVATAPGALPRNDDTPAPVTMVSVPQDPAQAANAPVEMAHVPMPEPAPEPKIGQAPPQPKPTSIAGLIGNIFAAAPTPAEAAEPTAIAEPPAHQQTANGHPVKLHAGHGKTELAAKAKHPANNRVAHNTAKPTAKPETTSQAAAQASDEGSTASGPQLRTAYSAPAPSNRDNTLRGAQPVVPVGSFDSRWTGLR
ncbi:MAG: L,D-transpeptidase family protein [Rhodopseudomonas sp.]|nr:L,D-transpeptidase family protein [Rhodopseudomonas sp.]